MSDKEIDIIFETRDSKRVDCQIFVYDNRILFYPILPCLEKALQITEKALECNADTKWKRAVVFRKRELYATCQRQPGIVGVTFQGFLARIAKALLTDGKTFDVRDMRVSTVANGFPAPQFDRMFGFRFSQESLLKTFLGADRSGLLGAPTRYGKCEIAGTKVLMHDYSIKVVEDVVVGDLLMGPDGLPRKVIALGHGREQAYRVVPRKGEPFGCNKSHILSLHTPGGVVVNMTIKEYLEASDDFKQTAKLWYAKLDFPWKELEEDPFEAGKRCAAEHSRIPVEYLTADYAQRMDFLAGTADDTASVWMMGLYNFATTSEGLSEDLVRLCRGLGLCVIRTKEGDEYHIHASDRETTSLFDLEDIGEQGYFGFELEGPDKLYLNWDHCVTHNTTLMINTLRAFPDLTTVVTAPGVDLVRQLYDDIKKQIANREVKLICSGSRTKYPSDTGITVCSADSLEKCDFGATQLLLADEPHALVTESRLRLIDKFPHARRLGFGATLKGRFDGKDALIEGLFGPVIVERTYEEAVKEGAICPLHIIFLKVEVPVRNYYDRDEAYDAILFKNPDMAQVTKEICERVIPSDFQTLIFIKHEQQAELFLDAIGTEHTIAMAKRMNKSQRDDITERMKNNQIKRCLCTKIYVQGVTFSDVRVLINAEAGGNNTSAIQKPGRLAEIRQGKKCGIVIDFMFVPPSDVDMRDYSGEPWTSACKDSLARQTAYEEKGYHIHHVDTIAELQQVFDSIV